MFSKMNKIVLIILFFLMLFIIIQSPVVQAEDVSIGTIIGGADDFIDKGSTHTDEEGQPVQPFDQDSLKKVSDIVYNISLILGIVVAVIIGLIIGIKLMIGSASEKAEYKKTMIPYLIGAILIFGASAIAKAVIQMSKLATNS